ncbi:putative leucine-rich repeat-containing protein DDB_G0290503 isoform X2 [Mercenaria mercenaria]|uniref:putative leucine-rich repeat-containing protein DDB_G0290503 isoform X2 n=1 Tax=Mercenaria mercenaria TaxID=6596 RepID=UPI00234F2045|nr:putative leucine-rich repeat-containing protein DDB_G0290503 isoform X2 [Mercenaria mercenaria]
MDSSAFVRDKTLPIDLNESSNPDLLTEVTYGEVGIAPMMEKSSTGRMSPVRGRTMKEYDQQLGELKKENFNLKLRIYFMEERMNTKFNEEDVIKHNIELKVEMENYKKDLVEKQALLEKASETIDTLTSKYSEELEKEVINIKQECDDKVEKANQHAFELENELSALEDKMQELEEERDKELTPKLEMKDKQIQELTVNLEERDKEICDLEEKVKALKIEVTELKDHAERREEQLREEMECIRTNLGRKDRDIQRLSFIVQDKTSIEGVTALERDHFKDEVEDTKRGLERLQKNCDKQQQDLDKKSQLIGKLEDLLRTKEKEKQALQKAYDERTTVYTRSKGIISDLVKDTHIKEQKIKSLEEELRLLREELEALKAELQKAYLNRQKDADKIRELEENIEKLVRTLGKREGELENFRDLLEKAQNSLTMSEEAVECLQKQLEKERCKDRARDKRDSSDGDVSRLRQELADLHAQLKEREKQYQSKCDELDTVAQRLNIKVTTQGNGSDQSDMLQKILGEVQHLKGAVESERHLHIDINSTHMSGMPDGSPPHNTHISRSGSPPYSTHKLSQTDGSQTHDLDVVRPGSTVNHKPTVMGKNGSHIPVRHKSSSSSAPNELVSLHNQVTDLTVQVHDLKNTLKATEETCHCQTQKMKHYRNMLIENGLLPRSRSNSVPNLIKDSLSPRVEREKTRRLSTRASSGRCRSVSPTPVARRQTFIESPENIDKLVKENSKLKQQVDGYRRVLKVFQSRSPSPSEEGSSQDGEPAPMSSESASCLLSSWLDMLDKFLTELSHSDQEGHAQCPTSNMEVTRLRRGLVQARGAIQSLSETSLVEQDKLSEGRLSPDSGCSDNPASAHNTLKESPSNSPTGRKSTSPRSNVSSPRNNVGSRLPGQYNDKFDNGAQSRQVQGCDNTSSNKMRYQSNGSSTGSQSSPGSESDFAHRRRDAGADPRLSSQNSYQSIERLRQCSGVPNLQNFSVFSQLDSDASVFSTASGAPTTNGLQKLGNNTVPNIDIGDGAIREPKQLHNKQSYLDKFEQTFSPSFLGGEGDETFADFTNIGQQSLMKFDDVSLLDITSNDNPHNKTNTAEMQERIKSLEDIIHTYEEQIRQKSRPDMDSLQQQLAELRNLRIQLEKAMARNEILEKQLADLYRFSESTIQELKTQLAESDSDVREKVKIITEKEKIISETKVSLEQYRDNSARDSAELQLCTDRINSLEFELKNSKKTCEQLTEMCQQLKTAVEQYKRRCTQLEDDNKQHIEAVSRYESRVKELEEDVISRSELGSQTEALKTRVNELESDYQQWRENENKYKNLLSQTRLQVTELSGDLEVSRDEVRKRDSELHTFKAELENLRDVVEEQNQQLGEKTRYIDELKGEIEDKNNCLHEQDTVCQNLTSKLESFSSANSKLSTQLEQQRLTCADYKRQIEKQNLLTKDLKDKIDKLREELSQSIQNRESQDKLLMERQKELQESTRLKDKYLYNLKVTYKEFSKTKKELKEVQKKCEDTSALNSTLQTELSVRERLMEDKGDMLTDDDKHNMIGELLNELKLARIQMTKILEQNENIKQKMMELIQQKKEQQFRSQGTGQLAGSSKSEDSMDRSLAEEIPDISHGGNQTWPLYYDLTGGLPRTDNLSCSLPLRESTPGGPASSHHRSRKSDFPSHQPRRSDLLSQPSRLSDNKAKTTSSIQQQNEESSSRKLEDYVSMELNLSRKSFTEEPVLSSGNHFSIPGPIYKQGITDKCLLYNVNDSPKYLEGLTQVRIDSDIRSVFAIGMIDHFEKLRKETNESNVILKGLSTRVTERLKVFNTMPALESVEYSVLKEISYATENMRICLDSQLSLIGCFWTSELPAPNERGEFVNQKLLDKNAALREELATLMNTLDMNSSGCKRSEDMICRSLESTLDVVSRARHNLEYRQQQHRRYSPHRSPSHSPRK